MKKKALWKDIWVEIGKSPARFLALLAIITLGVAFFAGIKAAGPDMLDTANRYYAEKNLYDLKVLSTYGLEDKDIAILANMEGASVYPLKTLDIEMAGSDFLVKLLPYSDREGQVNQYELVSGRLPQQSGEIALDAEQNLMETYQIGDTISFKTAPTEGLSDEEAKNTIAIKDQAYTVVGFVHSPIYIERATRGSTTVGKGSLDGFAVVAEADLSGGVYTEVYLMFKQAQAEIGYTDAYDETIADLSAKTELALNGRPMERINEIRAEGQKKIKEAEDKLQEGKDKLSAAEQELLDARKKLDDGTKEYTDNKKLFEAKMADAESALNASQAELDSGKAEYEDGLATYNANKQAYDDAKADWETQKAAIQGQMGGDASIEAFLANVPDTQAGNEIAALAEELLAGQAELEAGQALLEEQGKALAERAAALLAKGDELQLQQSALEGDGATFQTEMAAFTAELTAFQMEKAAKEAEFSERQAAIAAQQLLLEAEPADSPDREAGLAELTGLQAALDDEKAALAQQEADLDAPQSALEQKGQSLAERQTALAAAGSAFEAERATEEAALAQDQTQLEADGQALTVKGEALLAKQQLLEEKVQAFMADAAAQIAQADQQFAEQGQLLEEGRLELAAALVKLQDGQAQVDSGRAELETQRSSGQQALDEAWQKIQQGEADYQAGLATFTAEKADVDKEIASGAAKVQQAKQDLADLIDPVYFVLDRSSNPGYQEYRDNADRMSAIAEIFPVFFFLIAALVSFTTMTRMVDEQRQQMGTLKGLGYSNFDIAKKFLVYATLACIAGTAIGLVAGYHLFPTVIFNAYGSLYNLPPLKINYYLSYALISITIALLCTIGPAALATATSLRENPASMMRPKAPKNGKRVFLERVTFIWKRLSFNSKITVRNLMRYKARNAMTVLGVAGCTALILTGYGVKNSISGLAEKQFNEVMRYDAIVALRPETSEENLASYDRLISDTPEITSHLKALQANYKVDKQGINLQDVTVFVPAETENINDFVRLQDRITKEPIPLTDEGAVISEKLANILDVGPGDTIEIRNDEMQTYQVPIQAVTENYTNHYLYLTPALYEKVFIKGVEPNTDLLVYEEPESWERSFGAAVMGEPGVALVTFISSVDRAFSDTLGSLDIVTLVLIISAAALAFVVLYNLTNINVSERIRELSTIKVLGFYDVEVSLYIYRETFILTLLGILVGFGLGSLLSSAVLKMAEVDFLLFPATILPLSYLYAAILSLTFSIIVMLIMHRKLKKVDMIEALKSVE